MWEGLHGWFMPWKGKIPQTIFFFLSSCFHCSDYMCVCVCVCVYVYPEYSLEELMLKLKLQYFGHLMWRADSLEKTLMLGQIEGRRRRGKQRMRCLDDITDSIDMSLSTLRKVVKDREAWCDVVHGFAKSRTWLGLNSKILHKGKSSESSESLSAENHQFQLSIFISLSISLYFLGRINEGLGYVKYVVDIWLNEVFYIFSSCFRSLFIKMY